MDLVYTTDININGIAILMLLLVHTNYNDGVFTYITYIRSVVHTSDDEIYPYH